MARKMPTPRATQRIRIHFPALKLPILTPISIFSAKTVKSGSAIVIRRPTKKQTITVKNLSDNSVKTYTDVKEFSGIVVSSSYSSYSNQKYEITISDGTYTYVYTTSIGNSTPQLKT